MFQRNYQKRYGLQAKLIIFYKTLSYVFPKYCSSIKANYVLTLRSLLVFVIFVFPLLVFLIVAKDINSYDFNRPKNLNFVNLFGEQHQHNKKTIQGEMYQMYSE